MDKNRLKLSIVISNYCDEICLKNTIDCLLKQTYKNIEIIVVDNCSLENISQIIDNYGDKRLRCIKCKKSNNSFQIRLFGADNATGDYIGFLDANDYVSVDFYRELMMKCHNFEYDIVVGNTVLELENSYKETQNLCTLNTELISDGKLFEEYFRQEGLNLYWSVVWNKIYSMDLWKKARKHYNVITNDISIIGDFVLSTILFFYAKSIEKIENGVIFCHQLPFPLTNFKNFSYEKSLEIIEELTVAFSFVENFLREKKIYSKYKINLYNWKHLYSIKYRYSIDESCLLIDEKVQLNKALDKLCDDKNLIPDKDFFYSHKTKWDDRLENLKLAIIDPEIEVVSFDIFDTLVVRPFLKPVDLFKMLDNDYRELRCCNNGISFSKMRPIAEAIAREEQFKANPSIQEITLDDIYILLGKLYDIEKKHLEIMKKKEQECEIKFCSRRQTAYELYELALAMNKKVICTSDMYLPEETIFSILKKNGYNNISKLYLSSTIKKTKSTGDLYKYVLDDLGIDASRMIHIGDNYQSDYEMAKSLGVKSFHFIKASDVMTDSRYTNCLSKMFTSSFPFWEDNLNSLNFFGIRTMIAVVANKYFDNPYRTFDKETDFNADPYLIGYYVLGMYQFGIAKWLIAGLKGMYDKISFMARDGYLAMESYKLMKKLYDDLPEEEYIYVSRKALMPIMIADKTDFYKLSDLVSYDSQSPKKVIKYLDNILDIDVSKLEKLCEKENIKFEEKFSNLEAFNKYIKLLVDNFYDEKVHTKNREKLRKYFDKLLGERPAVFDVGYSGRPEFYLSELIGRNVDTFFLNINKDEALEYSSLGGFSINTFFPAKPTATGNAYEHIISKLAPSCISYDLSKDIVEPVFEEYENSYQVEHIIEVMQNAALSFIKDMIDIFGKDIDLLYYQDYYISLPILAYFNSAKEIDKLPLSAILFEDEIRTGNSTKMILAMYNDLKSKNQQHLHDLEYCPLTLGKKNVKFDYNALVKLTNSDTLKYNPIVDLNKYNKITRLIFYLFFDRETLSRRLDGIIYQIKNKIKKMIRKK